MRDHSVERAEDRHHADDREALGERLQHHGELDGAPDREPSEHLGEHEVGGGEQHVAEAMRGGHREEHPHDREAHPDTHENRERPSVRSGARVR